MNYKDFFSESNSEIRERYELVRDRIRDIFVEEKTMTKALEIYFVATAEILEKVSSLYEMLENNLLNNAGIEYLQDLNISLYGDIVGANYNYSYANPKYIYNCISKEADEELAKKYTRILSFLNAEVRACIPFAYEFRLGDITIIMELFMEIYNIFNDNDEESDIYRSAKSAIYYYVNDYSDIRSEYRRRETLDPSLDFATNIIMNADLEDYRYLYSYGEYISDTEIEIAKHLNTFSQEEIDAMAFTYTNGYKVGFENNNIDLSKKSAVNIRYNIGFERIIRAAIIQFRQMGLEPIIYRYGLHASNRGPYKVGYQATSPNKQYDYDHRFDNAVFLDKALLDKSLNDMERILKNYEDLAADYAGPAVVEIFGEVPFAPEKCEYANKLSAKQEKLKVEHTSLAAVTLNKYIKREETSFTIIAFPIPEIGNDFKEIFNETVKVNTLNMDVYKNVQQSIIDALDKGDYVHVSGMNGNKTDIKINLYELQNPDKETLFENCLADVNIPVGEVFTSPVLKGTNGVLHVSEVYLNELKYNDLMLSFEDGMVKDYSCKNFDNIEDGKRMIKENVLFNHETLPIGEFAIGTNTTAYVMGRKFNISDKLPILIAEKTGPHFAIGDTCYSMSEDTKVYNPDGKEIVAKDNEKSVLRKTDMTKAYYNCHTDITIPYDELGEIAVYTKTGDKITIISEGRFVLEGTEVLNEAFNA